MHWHLANAVPPPVAISDFFHLVMRRVLVYGGSGALGRSVLSNFKASGWEGINVDINSEAHIQVDPSNLHTSLDAIQVEPVDAVIATAGGWQGGSVEDSSVVNTAMQMYQMNTLSSVAAAHLATRFMKTNGMLIFTGAIPALAPTYDMIGYGMSKAAVHHLTQSMATKYSNVAAILPVTIDTEANRNAMPDADYSSWTPCSAISEELLRWTQDSSIIINGGLYGVFTTDGKTVFTLQQAK